MKEETALDRPHLVQPLALTRLTSSKLMIPFGAMELPLLEVRSIRVSKGAVFLWQGIKEAVSW